MQTLYFAEGMLIFRVTLYQKSWLRFYTLFKQRKSLFVVNLWFEEDGDTGLISSRMSQPGATQNSK